MQKKITSLSILFILLFTIFPCCSAKDSNSVQSQFGPDADYYIGLNLLRENKTNEAVQKFNACAKNGSYYCARRSIEQLTQTGNIQDKIKACELLASKYKDEDAIFLACKELSKENEYGKILKFTQDIDILKCKNELAKIKLTALKRQNASSYTAEVLKWYVYKPISSEHYTFYRDIYDLPLEQEDYSITDFLITYRIDIYRKNYSLASEKVKKVTDLLSKKQIEFYPQIISDLGKTYLYTSTKYTQNANTFCSYAKANKDSDSEFYFWFYAGRFFEKADNITSAEDCFSKAISSAKDPNLKDNAIWYLLNTKITQAYKPTIKQLNKYASQWNDKDYFDDFFEKLIPSLLANQDYKYFEYLLNQTDGYASDEVVSKIAYIYARLLQEGLIVKEGKKQELIQKSLERATNSGTNVYYKIMAAFQLGYDEETVINLLCQTPKNDPIQVDSEAEKLLKGYIYFGFPEKIYNEWNYFYKKGISTDVSMELADFLKKCGHDDPKYYPLSIRIAARSANISDRPLTKEEVKLVYPNNFKNYVESYSAQYEISDSILYSLIRSESFFDADVVSTAGAVGLTQLMELTGVDIASKLKLTDYSLKDPQTNIQFGTFYLSQLIKRCDNSYMNAFFSYNAGITRVRRWLKTSKIGVKGKSRSTRDLFLETIPYTETREYGRKLISATVFYELFYANEQTTHEPVNFTTLMGQLLQ